MTDAQTSSSETQRTAQLDREQIEPQQIVVAGQALCVFPESPAMIRSLVEDIQAARHRVWIECYIFLNDSAGQAVAEALKARARTGVQVRLLYDAIGSQSTSNSFFQELVDAGVEVHAYHTLWDAIARGTKVFHILNRRNHRKLVVIDERVAYFGGMNIVDQGTPESESTMRALPISAAWRDVHVRLVGSSQIELAESFDLSWRRAHHLRVPRRSRRYRRASFANEQESIRFFDSGPGPRNSRAARIFRRLFNTGRNNVLLSMAYFIPTGRVLRALLRARRRGVRIEVVLPGESDVKLVQWATQHLYAKLLRHGLSIYERKQRMLHSKVMVVDDEWTVIGSCNLDPRSLRINLEFLAVIRSRTLASKITDLCKHEIANSRQVTCESCERRNWWQRLRDRMAYSLRNWL